ncbi:MAG: hypothetical protein J4473_05915 [Candidatus Aenigmarchaeota archaeon]|nr:hypothetical protein [Candidatus Aenigmarchaeota archaeon]
MLPKAAIFAKHGIEGLQDLPRPGKPCIYGHDTHTEFLSFVKDVYKKWGRKKELHFVIDNFSAHKHKDVMKWVLKIIMKKQNLLLGHTKENR